MAETLVGGAAFRATFGEVFAVLRDTIKDVVHKVRMYKPILKRLESTLNRLTPMVNQIRELGKQFDLPEEETKRLME